MNSTRYNYIKNDGKPVILFLHGFLGSREDWLEIGAALKNDFSYLMVDLPWHGKSAGVSNMKKAASSIVALLDSLFIKQVYLYGYSLGGRLALYLTLFYPEYFKRVILESSSPGLKNQSERQERLAHDEKLAQRLENDALSDFLAFWYAMPLFKNLVKQKNFPRIYERRLQNSPNRLAQSLRTLGTGRQPSLWEKLKSNVLPIRLIVGEFDEKFVQIAREMTAVNNNISLEIVKNSGHTVYAEKPTSVVKTIQVFFAE